VISRGFSRDAKGGITQLQAALSVAITGELLERTSVNGYKQKSEDEEQQNFLNRTELHCRENNSNIALLPMPSLS